MKNNNVELTREDLKIVPESPTMERQELTVPCEFSVRNFNAISDETSDTNPAVEPSDQTQAAKLVPLVYRVDEIAQLLAISNRAAYNLCNTTKDFKVIRLGTSIRVSKATSEERAIWDEKTMLAALQTMTAPTLHLAVHLSMILSLRVGEILGLQPGDIDFDAADGRGTITVGRSLQRTEKAALEKTDPNQIYHTFPDQREDSSSALVLKKPKTKKSSRTLYLTKPLKEELLAWLERLKQDELAMDGRYRNCGQLFRLPNGLPVAPEALSKWYRAWRAEHPEFEKIVFHGLRHSSATYQLIESGGNIKAVQGNTGHATTGILMDTYAHTQDKPRLELAEKIEADFYSQNVGGKPGSAPEKQNLPDAAQITPEVMLTVVRQMNPEQRREFTRLLFA